MQHNTYSLTQAEYKKKVLRYELQARPGYTYMKSATNILQIINVILKNDKLIFSPNHS